MTFSFHPEAEEEFFSAIEHYEERELGLGYRFSVEVTTAIANAAGADFRIMGPRHTMIDSTKPVIAVCAVRTGCGKSQTSRAVSTLPVRRAA